MLYQRIHNNDRVILMNLFKQRVYYGDFDNNRGSACRCFEDDDKPNKLHLQKLRFIDYLSTAK